MLMWLHFIQSDNCVLYDNVVGLALTPTASIVAMLMPIHEF